MKLSVGRLISSLKDLGVVLEKTQTVTFSESNDLELNPDEYTKAILSKILFDLPVQVCLLLLLISSFI